MYSVSDQVVIFGPSGRFVGIVTEPVGLPSDSSAAGEQSNLPAIVFINTGIIHRVGVNRMNTIWSRRLAAAGHTVLRFDLSGIGDSERRDVALPPLESTMADIRDAVDWLQTSRETNHVIMIGLCAGADGALVYAGTDPRIVGLVLIDPTIPPTWRYLVIRSLREIINLESWRRQLSKRAVAFTTLYSRLRGLQLPDDPPSDPLSSLKDPAVRAAIARAYKAALVIKVSMLIIFTDGVRFQHNYRRQLIDAFPDIQFGGLMQLEYFKRCDHLFSFEADRTRLFRMTTSWISGKAFKSRTASIQTPTVPLPSRSMNENFLSVEF